EGTPLIGRSGIDNLWLNVGHGSLGFTLACGSADLLASEIGGLPPAVSLQGLSLTC
ncbi:MAG TPA: amino acid dehydrogenase, partial [Pseudomonas sp.]|nr:amino acid dehydrogenase [Pseudomonas sp.]